MHLFISCIKSSETVDTFCKKRKHILFETAFPPYTFGFHGQDNALYKTLFIILQEINTFYCKSSM